ncbi:hypothetical protein [Terricaulis sp.]|uniref:hypothetical protein n=1 Tax=Terricaulis sp. TaxID=2768686 RepID=UPI0037837B0D
MAWSAGMFRIARTLALGIVALFFAANAMAQARGSAVLAQAVAATQAAKTDYAFDWTLNTAKQTWRARFDPNATPRLRMLAPDPSNLKNDEREGFERLSRDMEGVSWCASETMGRVSNVQLVRNDGATSTYSFQPTRESIRGEQARRFADRLRGEMTMLNETPDITRVRLFAPAAFSPMPLVNVERIDIVITCTPAPNGRRYASETVSEVHGSAFGQAFDERSVQRFSNLQAAP